MSFVLSKIAAKLMGPSILWIQQTTITGTLLDLQFFFYFSRFWSFLGVNGEGGGGGSKLDQKSERWIHPVSIKIAIFEILFKHCFLS